MKNTFTNVLLILIVLSLAGCKKNYTIVGNPENSIRTYPPVLPQNKRAYWINTFETIYGDSLSFQYIRDSIYLSNETVDLKIINSFNPDTVVKTYKIGKVKRSAQRFRETTPSNLGVFNFFIYRTDSNNSKLYGVYPEGYKMPSNPQYPSKQLFYERIVSDMTLKSNDEVYIKTIWEYYNGIVKVEKSKKGNFEFIKHFFTDKLNPTDTVSCRTQFCGIMNLTTYNFCCVPNTVRSPSTMEIHHSYYYENGDRVEIENDTGIYP